MAASAAAAGSSPGLCPSFAVICSFLERYGAQLDLPELTFPQLERDVGGKLSLLVDLHVKLLRKIGKSVSADRWEKYLVRICQEFNTTWAWELEKKGYLEMTVECKTGILKYLCECQFDDNVKFKTAINEEDPDKMRLQPIGRDKDGLMYWFQLDQDHNVRVYVEEQDDLDGSSWKCIVRNRDDLAQILGLLKTQIDPALLVKKDQEEGSSSNSPNPEDEENKKKDDGTTDSSTQEESVKPVAVKETSSDNASVQDRQKSKPDELPEENKLPAIKESQESDALKKETKAVSEGTDISEKEKPPSPKQKDETSTLESSEKASSSDDGKIKCTQSETSKSDQDSKETGSTPTGKESPALPDVQKKAEDFPSPQEKSKVENENKQMEVTSEDSKKNVDQLSKGSEEVPGQKIRKFPEIQQEKKDEGKDSVPQTETCKKQDEQDKCPEAKEMSLKEQDKSPESKDKSQKEQDKEKSLEGQAKCLKEQDKDKSPKEQDKDKSLKEQDKDKSVKDQDKDKSQKEQQKDESPKEQEKDKSQKEQDKEKSSEGQAKSLKEQDKDKSLKEQDKDTSLKEQDKDKSPKEQKKDKSPKEQEKDKSQKEQEKDKSQKEQEKDKSQKDSSEETGEKVSEEKKTETGKKGVKANKEKPSEEPQEGIRIKLKVPVSRRKADLLRDEGKGDSESEASEGRCLRRSPRICRPSAKVVEIQDRKVEKKQATSLTEKDKDESDEKEEEEITVQKKPRERKVDPEDFKVNSDSSTSCSEEELPNDDPCKHCGLPNHPELILLCDSCDNGYHTACLRPPLMIIPDGEWFCPPCQHKLLCDKLEEQLVNIDAALKKKERAERRKERLVYVGISVENIITPSFDEAIEEAIEEDIKEAEGGGAGRGKDMANITGHRGKDMSTILQEEGKENGRPQRTSTVQRRKKRRRLNDLDSDSTVEEEESEDEFRLSERYDGFFEAQDMRAIQLDYLEWVVYFFRVTEGSSDYSENDLDMRRRRSHRSRKQQVNYRETSDSDGSQTSKNKDKQKSRRRLSSSESEEEKESKEEKKTTTTTTTSTPNAAEKDKDAEKETEKEAEDVLGKGVGTLDYNLEELPATNGQSPMKSLEGLVPRPAAGTGNPALVGNVGLKNSSAPPPVAMAANGLAPQEMAPQDEEEDDLLGVTDLVDYVCNSEQL
uniref:Remodeling and spacing factor 1 n=1 Tax=Astyanax mexicanus TaxID=7994 RepID=A0A3B1JLM7_ASTMX